MADQAPSGLRGFFAYYDSVHQHPMNRLFHACAFTQAIVAFVLIGTGVLWWPFGLGLALASYAWAWTGHFAFEKNMPATFSSPIRSLVFGFLWFFMLAATLGRYRVAPATPSPTPAGAR